MQDNGWSLRLNVLRQDVDTKLLRPLSLHGWSVTIEHEEEVGEYLLIKARRGDIERQVAVLYSSATDNKIYRKLDGKVDAILFNGQPYMVHSFAYGIATPVSSADDFHQIMVEWNRSGGMQKLSPSHVDIEQPATKNPRRRSILSETPIEAIWARLAQLKSTTLARRTVKQRAELDATELCDAMIQSKGEGVAFALRNAADYFSSHDRRNVSQRVLNLYYGSLSFAFAEMLASPDGPHTLSALEDITKQGHGLYMLDGLQGGVENLVVGALSSGFFPAWAKSMTTDPISVVDKKPRRVEQLTAQPPNSWVTMERLFARIPEVSDLFEDIFDGPPAWVTPVYDMEANARPGMFGRKSRIDTSYILLVDDSGRLTAQDIAMFSGPVREITQVPSGTASRHFRAAVDHPDADYWWGALRLHHSSFERNALILPLFEGVCHYRAICVVLLYSLSILVRYRPSLWRRIQEGDLDHLRALIEMFLAAVERTLPEEFLAHVTGEQISVQQPGSLFS